MGYDVTSQHDVVTSSDVTLWHHMTSHNKYWRKRTRKCPTQEVLHVTSQYDFMMSSEVTVWRHDVTWRHKINLCASLNPWQKRNFRAKDLYKLGNAGGTWTLKRFHHVIILGRQYKVEITTCNAAWAGTDGDVKLDIEGSNGGSIKGFNLDDPYKNDFEQGKWASTLRGHS